MRAVRIQQKDTPVETEEDYLTESELSFDYNSYIPKITDAPKLRFKKLDLESDDDESDSSKESNSKALRSPLDSPGYFDTKFHPSKNDPAQAKPSMASVKPGKENWVILSKLKNVNQTEGYQ